MSLLADYSSASLGMAGRIQSILSKISVPGVIRAGNLALAGYGTIRNGFREWSGKAYGATSPRIDLPDTIFPFAFSTTALYINASTTVGELIYPYRFIVGNINVGVPLLGELTSGSTEPLPNGTGDVFKAFTKTEFGSSPYLLTPFTAGANANASLFPGYEQGNASLKVFLMGVGLGGVYSTGANTPNISVALSGGFSFLVGRGRERPVDPAPRP